MSQREELDLSGGGLFGNARNGHTANGTGTATIEPPAAAEPPAPAAAPAAPPGEPEPTSPATAARGRGPGSRRASSGRRSASADAGLFDPKPKRHQLNAKILAGLHTRYMRMIADLRFDEEFETDLTELLNAMLYFGPQTGGAVREMVEQWREVRDGRTG